MKKQVSIIPGCSGFIGSHVANELIRMGHEAIGVDDLSEGFLINNPEGMKFIQGSVADSSFINELFVTYQFDYVYHLAAYAAEGLSHFISKL